MMEFAPNLFASPEAQEEFFRRCEEERYDIEHIKELLSYCGANKISSFTGKPRNTFDNVVEHVALNKQYQEELKRLREKAETEPVPGEARPRGRPKAGTAEAKTSDYETAKRAWREAKDAEAFGVKQADDWAAEQWEQIKRIRDERKAQLREDVRAKRAVMDEARKV